MCFYLLVYPSFPPSHVLGAVSLVVTPPGASESKAKMVAPCGRVGANVQVMPEVAWCSLLGLLAAPREFGPSVSYLFLGIICIS